MKRHKKNILKNNPPNEFRNWLHFFRYQEDNSTYKFRSSSKVGHEFGLKLTLFLDYAEYIGLFAPNSGARLLVHDPRVQPDIQTASFSVAAGETTFIAMRRQIQRLLREVAQITETFGASSEGMANLYTGILSEFMFDQRLS